MRQAVKPAFFESPHAVTYIVILLNGAVFAFTLIGSSLARIEPVTLLQYGALYRDALSRHEYWRFIGYAFLHANILHLALNMLCIAAWSGLLEHRLGATYFIFVYLVSAIGGGVASALGHTGAFMTVGASGAISGILGGLLCLTMLGKMALSPQFFLITIGANVALGVRVPNVDWMAHIGGFTAGFAACAILDAVEHVNRFWLRCKFPEFVKLGLAAIAISAAGYLAWTASPASGDLLSQAFVAGFALFCAIKVADLLISARRGLGVLAFAIALLWGVLTYASAALMSGNIQKLCQAAIASTSLQDATRYFGDACQHLFLWSIGLGAAAFAVALSILSPELRRGITDAGFVAYSLRAERNRRSGL